MDHLTKELYKLEVEIANTDANEFAVLDSLNEELNFLKGVMFHLLQADN